MKKILITAHIDQHIRHFHKPYINWFKDNGYHVSTASNGDEQISNIDQKYDVGFSRNPISVENFKAFFQMRKIINSNDFELIHCHTPVGGLITRLAAIKARKKGTKVLYTAHGFHFFKGSKKVNWIVYYTLEKLLARITDTIITINSEDYSIASNKGFKAKKIEFVKGVGVNFKTFSHKTNEEKLALRSRYNINEDDFVLIYVAELSIRKNQKILIEAMSLLKNDFPDIKLLLVGKGVEVDNLKETIEIKKLTEQVKLLGYRQDISNLMGLSDVAISSSKQEGLPVNIIEAMGMGLPLIVSDCRGNRDLVVDNKNGYIVKTNSPKAYIEKILKLYKLNNSQSMSKLNLKLSQQYSIENIVYDMEKIYLEMLNRGEKS